MDTLTPTGLLWDAVDRPVEPYMSDPDGSRCACCGRRDIPHLHDSAVLARTFNDHDILRGGDRICAACTAYFRRAGKGRTLRTSHIVLSRSAIETPSTNRLQAMLLEGSLPDPPLLVTVAVSYKKHLLIRARVALSINPVCISLEQEQGIVRMGEHARLSALVTDLLGRNFFRGEVRAMKMQSARARSTSDLDAWRTAVKTMRGKTGAFAWRLAVRLAKNPKGKP